LYIRGLLLTSAVTIAACQQHAPEEDPVAQVQVYGSAIGFTGNRAPPAIATQSIASTDNVTFTLPGRLAWDEDQTVRVFTPFSGRVSKIVAALGDKVKSGGALAILSSADYGSAQSDYQKAVANQTLTRHALERARDLFAHGVIAQKDVEQAEADAATADAEAQRTQRVLRTYNDAGSDVSQELVLRSPISGVVVERAINPGQELRADQSNAAQFVVTNPESLWIVLDARETDLPHLHPGTTFDFKVSPYAEETFTGTIIRVADYVDPVTRTIKVLGHVDNKDRRLKGEMFVTATLRSQTPAQPEAVSKAVLLVGDKHFVFVRKGALFERREVQVGNEQAGRVAILSGVGANDEVVTDGALYLQSLLQSHAG